MSTCSVDSLYSKVLYNFVYSRSNAFFQKCLYRPKFIPLFPYASFACCEVVLTFSVIAEVTEPVGGRAAIAERHAKSVQKHSTFSLVNIRSLDKKKIDDLLGLRADWGIDILLLTRGTIAARCLLEFLFLKSFLLSTEPELEPELTTSPSAVITEASP